MEERNNPIGASDPQFVINAGGAPSIQEGPLFIRPLTADVGALFLDTDQRIFYRFNGSFWEPLQQGPPGPPGPRGVGIQGPPGPAGPQGPAGPAGGLSSVLYRRNGETVNVNIVAIGGSAPIPFNSAGAAQASFGTPISFASPDTFNINETGFYRVTFILDTAMVSILGNVFVNYTPVGGASPNPAGAVFPLLAVNTQTVGDVVFQVTTPGSLQLLFSASVIGVGVFSQSSITIEKLTP